MFSSSISTRKNLNFKSLEKNCICFVFLSLFKKILFEAKAKFFLHAYRAKKSLKSSADIHKVKKKMGRFSFFEDL